MHTTSLSDDMIFRGLAMSALLANNHSSSLSNQYARVLKGISVL